jgi:ferredoxin-thioredoxin reductase catalytic subunit
MSEKKYTLFMIQKKLLWRCHVCNDLHFGERAPVLCPTCGARNAFVLVDRGEALELIGERGGALTAIDEVIKIWGDFGGSSKEFKLVEDMEMVRGLAEGVLENQKNHGLKYCPCRITTGDPVNDLKLVCPCNFQIQQSYKERGECWCGLFAKR